MKYQKTFNRQARKGREAYLLQRYKKSFAFSALSAIKKEKC
jgi:hypothetical protein